MDSLIGKSLADPKKPWIVTCRCDRTPEAFVSCDAQGKTTDAQGRTFGNGGEWDGVHLLCPCGVILRMEDWVVSAVQPKADATVPQPASPPSNAAEAVERLSKLGVAVVVMVRDYLVDGHTVSEQELLAMAAGINTPDELSMYFSRGR